MKRMYFRQCAEILNRNRERNNDNYKMKRWKWVIDLYRHKMLCLCKLPAFFYLTFLHRDKTALCVIQLMQA